MFHPQISKDPNQIEGCYTHSCGIFEYWISDSVAQHWTKLMREFVNTFLLTKFK